MLAGGASILLDSRHPSPVSALTFIVRVLPVDPLDLVLVERALACPSPRDPLVLVRVEVFIHLSVPVIHWFWSGLTSASARGDPLVLVRVHVSVFLSVGLQALST